MQQTEKYQLNLIEMDDTFSPAALNENAQKTEAAIEAARAEAADATAAGDDALDVRVQALEARHYAYGYYTGTGDTKVIKLEFTPQLVLIYYSASRYTMFRKGAGNSLHKVVEGGFQVGHGTNDSYSINGGNYVYLAFD